MGLSIHIKVAGSSGVTFDFDTGIRVAKMKYGDVCPEQFQCAESFWNEIKPLSFGEIMSIPNFEQRRVALSYIGIDNIVKETSSELLSSETITKKTKSLDENTPLQVFNDTYSLYRVPVSSLNIGGISGDYFYFVHCRDTSTVREYLLWVDHRSVINTNINSNNPLNPISAIAWTIMVQYPIGKIDFIIRQGDCILVYPKDGAKKCDFRHLTESEYRELMYAES